MIAQACRAMMDHWDRLPAGVPRPQHLHYWIDGTGAEKASIFLLADDSPEPCLVAKMARSAAGVPPLRREHRFVTHVRSLCPEHIRRAIPAQVMLQLPGDRVVLVEQHVPGTSLARLMANRRSIGDNAAELLAPAQDWLLDFSNATRLATGPRVRRAAVRMVDREAAEFSRTFTLSASELDFVRRTRDSVVDWLAKGGTLVPMHGDLEPGNVLLCPAGIGILDWGFGRPLGLPGFDLLFLLLRFLTRAAGLSRMQAREDEYCRMADQAFWHEAWQSRLAHDALQEYWRRLALPPAELETILGLFLITTANAYHRYLSDRAEWGWLFLPRPVEGQSFREALREIIYVQLLRYLAANSQALLWRELGRPMRGTPGAMGAAGGRPMRRARAGGSPG